MSAHSSPNSSALRLPLTDRLAYLALLLFLFGFGFQWGFQHGVESMSASANEDFYPAWAARARFNLPLWVRDTESGLGRLNLRPKQLALKDLARVHGHLCDGLVISWVELSAALRTLFPRGIVDRTDLRVVSKNGPCWVDAAAWMTGARVNHGTLVLDNRVGDGFVVQRISSGEAVQVSLRSWMFPEELMKLERSIRTRRAADENVLPEEIDRFEALATEVSRRLLSNPPYRVVEVRPLNDFAFPTFSPNQVASRSDILNRNLGRAERSAEGSKK